MVQSSNSLVVHQDDLHTGSAKRAQANGVASLDAAGKVPIAEVGAVELTSNKNVASGYAGLDVNTRVAQSNSFLAVPSVATGKLIDTEYQNGNRPRLVSIHVILNIGTTNTSMALAYLCIKNAAGVALGDNNHGVGLNTWAVAAIVNFGISAVITRIIPANYYYKLISSVTATGTITVSLWDETNL